MAASIALTYNITQTEKGTCKLSLITTGTEIDSRVFAIEVLPKSADPEAPIYRFSHICSPAEMVEFPADEPMDNSYFRVSEIEMIFDTPVIVEHVMDNMREDIAKLVNETNGLNTATSTGGSILFQ